MAKEKKPVHKVQMTDGKRQIIQQLLQEYDVETAEDIQDALKDLLGGTIKEMMEAEMEDHLGYQKSERYDNDDYRNGYKTKRVNSSFGSLDIQVPQDRKSSFEPQVVKKRQKDISNIDQKIISMYAKGMTTRQISDTLEDIYGFEASEGFISDVTDKILPQIEEWQHRPLEDVYPVIFIDAIHYSVRDNGIIRKLAAYIIYGIRIAIGFLYLNQLHTQHGNLLRNSIYFTLQCFLCFFRASLFSLAVFDGIVELVDSDVHTDVAAFRSNCDCLVALSIKKALDP